ncbi:rhomboid family intramembrane serine protease [Crystallibacter degradans]|uniref:rhomboid family intramembrane serine protease n=1 Tax=Crystallibacter degradans TaxID=2726743 RepID=UPI0014764AEB|nr:rhomboid family intramembrane serine protease [Arthrobacter sp. SF27]NMR28844.1 rhomboid family intramembrane serine protease [Arthrobacter sp. SF27]
MSYGMPAEQPQSEVPVCPRHPDRISYVRCQRCGRPTCPECQRTAAVGIQCVDCVKEQARNLPTHRTVYGGAVTTGRPVVTLTIIALCVAIYILQWVLPGVIQANLVYAPLYTAQVPGLPFEPWRMITAGFLHSTGLLLHIAFNMYALWIFGQHLEPLLGRLKFVALYLLSIWGGSVAVLLLGEINQGVVGASGGVFGLFTTLLIVQLQRKQDVRGILVLIGINVVISFFPGISWQAHIGGMVTGALAAAAIAFVPRGENQQRLQWAGLAGIAVLLVVLTWIGSSMVTLPQ